MNFQETKNYIIQELKENKDENYENFIWDEIQGVNDFLNEFTNSEHSLEEYFDDWEFNNDIIFECINYINQSCIEFEVQHDITIDMIDSEEKIKNLMIYWVGHEIRYELLEDGERLENGDILEKIIPDYVIVPEVA